MIKATLTPEAQSIIRRLGSSPRVLQEIRRGLDLENDFTVSHAQRVYMSFPKDGPTTRAGLRVITNHLRRSIRREPAAITGERVLSAIGSNIKYAAIHEFGGTTKPHTITAKHGKALAIPIGGRTIFRKSVRHPGSKIPARAPIQSAIKDRLKDYSQSLSAAVLRAWAHEK